MELSSATCGCGASVSRDPQYDAELLVPVLSRFVWVEGSAG